MLALLATGDWCAISAAMSAIPWTILVEKEETLAASSRLHSTFVSKFIKTEMKKDGGVGKAKGGRRVLGDRQTERRRREHRDNRHVQQGEHFYSAKKVCVRSQAESGNIFLSISGRSEKQHLKVGCFFYACALLYHILAKKYIARLFKQFPSLTI